MKAHETRFEAEVAVDARRAARRAGTEQRRHVRQATRLSTKARYGKVAKALAQCATVDPASQAVQTKMRALHPTPLEPVSIIPERDLAPKPFICPDRVHASMKDMYKDSATVPGRSGVRWLLLVASNELRQSPDIFGLQLLTCVIAKKAAGDFPAHVGHLLSAANLIPLDKKETRVRPISIGIVLRRLVTRSLMPKTVAEAKDYLFPLQVGCGVQFGTDAAIQYVQRIIGKYGDDLNYVLLVADAENVFNRAGREEMLQNTAQLAPSLIRLAMPYTQKASLTCSSATS